MVVVGNVDAVGGDWCLCEYFVCLQSVGNLEVEIGEALFTASSFKEKVIQVHCADVENEP